MYAIVNIAGRQYRVSPDQQFRVDHLKVEPGTEVTVDKVMLVSDGENVEVGNPHVAYRVKMEVVKHDRYPKVVSYRFKRRGGARKTHGHRQHFTLVKVTSIEKGGE